MLDKQTIRKINDFVYQKPRTIQEISHLINKSWLTTDRYLQKIANEEGTIAVRTFRGGTRGALKIVYWNLNPVQKSSFQERLQKHIEAGRKKTDFSPSEIYQYINRKKKKAWIVPDRKYFEKGNFENLKNLLMQAENQVLVFSGNLSFCNLNYKNKKIMDIIEYIAKRGVAVRILTRVEHAGIETIKDVLSINSKMGREVIEIRHCYQPLRATIIDSKVASMKEVLDPENYVKGELKEKVNIIYRVFDSEWVEWLQRIFWTLFRSSISAEKRIEDLEKIRIA
jgi:hypothetical protein